jgi:hypothetical protein
MCLRLQLNNFVRQSLDLTCGTTLFVMGSCIKPSSPATPLSTVSAENNLLLDQTFDEEVADHSTCLDWLPINGTSPIAAAQVLLEASFAEDALARMASAEDRILED